MSGAAVWHAVLRVRAWALAPFAEVEEHKVLSADGVAARAAASPQRRVDSPLTPCPHRTHIMEPSSVDEEAKEAPGAASSKAEKRLSFRQRMSFRANFTQGWSERVSGVIVARPRAILACMFAVAVLVIVGLAGVGVEVSVQTQ